jgi:cytochrome bd-type quinol oxidase subunit 2
MSLTIKIAVFYGAPILALALAIAGFAWLLVRVRRGVTSRPRAAALYAGTLLLPIASVVVVWATAELASYLDVASGPYAWNGSAPLELFFALLPIAAYVGIPVVALVILFWIVLALGGRSRP